MIKIENNELENVSGGWGLKRNKKEDNPHPQFKYAEIVKKCESSLQNIQQMRETLTLAYGDPNLTEEEKRIIYTALENLMDATEQTERNKALAAIRLLKGK